MVPWGVLPIAPGAPPAGRGSEAPVAGFFSGSFAF